MRFHALALVAAILCALPAQADPPAQASDRPVASTLLPAQPAAVPSLTTTQPTPIYRRWYFWAGVGAAVVATTLALAVATQNVGPRKLTSEQICGNSCDACIGPVCDDTVSVGSFTH